MRWLVLRERPAGLLAAFANGSAVLHSVSDHLMAGQTSNEPKQLRSSAKGSAESKEQLRWRWKRKVASYFILLTKKCKKGHGSRNKRDEAGRWRVAVCKLLSDVIVAVVVSL